MTDSGHQQRDVEVLAGAECTSCIRPRGGSTTPATDNREIRQSKQDVGSLLGLGYLPATATAWLGGSYSERVAATSATI